MRCSPTAASVPALNDKFATHSWSSAWLIWRQRKRGGKRPFRERWRPAAFDLAAPPRARLPDEPRGIVSRWGIKSRSTTQRTAGMRKERALPDRLANGTYPPLCCRSRSLRYGKRAPGPVTLPPRPEGEYCSARFFGECRRKAAVPDREGGHRKAVPIARLETIAPALMRFEISKGLQLINFNLKEAMTVVSKRNVRKRTRDHTPESVGAFQPSRLTDFNMLVSVRSFGSVAPSGPTPSLKRRSMPRRSSNGGNAEALSTLTLLQDSAAAALGFAAAAGGASIFPNCFSSRYRNVLSTSSTGGAATMRDSRMAQRLVSWVPKRAARSSSSLLIAAIMSMRGVP